MSEVIRLVTTVDRAAAEQAEYAGAAHCEAVSMLERALELVRASPTSSVAVAIAFQDRSYASLVPISGDDIGLLKGAVMDMAHRLCVAADR